MRSNSSRSTDAIWNARLPRNEESTCGCGAVLIDEDANP
jgi:hypothetical protein